MDKNWKFLEFGIFGIRIQRRGVHVSIPKIGSRAGLYCFGGIWGPHADLRREFEWGNFNLGFFWVLFVVPRRYTEEGDHLCSLCVVWGNFK
jgi:hypothetical protein